MDYNGTDLSKLFFEEPVMTRAEVRAWWGRYGLACLSETKIVRTVYLNWSEIATFPRGHELQGQVKQGEEERLLREHFSACFPCGTPKYRVNDMVVVQQCPCGKTACESHVFPSTVEIDSNVPLELHMKRKVIPFERTYRALDAMMFVDVMDWFAGYPLKWEVSVTPRLGSESP